MNKRNGKDFFFQFNQTIIHSRSYQMMLNQEFGKIVSSFEFFFLSWLLRQLEGDEICKFF